MNIRFVPLRVHAAADYLVGASFFFVPILVTFPPSARLAAWIVAAVHFGMTILTDYPGGLLRVIPMRFHLTVELILGPVLVALPWLLGFSDHRIATGLFSVWGVISFLTFFVTIRTERSAIAGGS